MELTGNVQGLIDLVGGGSDVEFEQVLESGEKIGVITIDNVPTDIYAPDGAEVEVTQVLSSGTKIATIEVDGEGVDLYAPTPEEPTSIEVTQVVSSGTKIATIVVDGVDTDLYAPKGGIDYSTNEQIIGTWIDGKPLYRKTWNFDSPVLINANGWENTNIVVADEHIYMVIGCDAISDNGTKWGFISATTDSATITYLKLLNVRNTSVYVKYLTLDYTKTTD